MAAIETVTDPADLRALHAALLVPSFPPSERGTDADLVAAVAAGRSTVWAVRDAGRWLGCAVVEWFAPGVDLALLEWLAVGGSTRGTGLGARLVSHVVGDASGDAGYVLAEIEDPAAPASEAAYGDPARRAAFYARLGARAILLPHDQPPLAPVADPVPLLLIALADGPVPDELPAGPLRAVLAAYRAGSPGWARAERHLRGATVRTGEVSAATFAATRRM